MLSTKNPHDIPEVKNMIKISPDDVKPAEQPQMHKADAAESKEKTITIRLIPVPSTENILHLESPRYREKCKRWKDIPELTHKRALETLLKQGKTPKAVADYLNCSPQQVYRAMKAHHISTARAYAPALLEHKLHLRDEKNQPKK